MSILIFQGPVLCLRWNPAFGVAGAANLYIQLMDALYEVNQNMLFLVQGPNQVNLTGTGGSSYVTNIPVQFAADSRDSDPNPFFKQLLIKPYVAQVCLLLHPSLSRLSGFADFFRACCSNTTREGFQVTRANCKRLRYGLSIRLKSCLLPILPVIVEEYKWSFDCQVVISPRVLAPSLAGSSNSSSGAALFTRLTNSFGYLNKQVRSSSTAWVMICSHEAVSMTPKGQAPKRRMTFKQDSRGCQDYN